LEIGDTADLEVCGTSGFQTRWPSANPIRSKFSTPSRFGNRRYSRLGSLRYGWFPNPLAVCQSNALEIYHAQPIWKSAIQQTWKSAVRLVSKPAGRPPIQYARNFPRPADLEIGEPKFGLPTADWEVRGTAQFRILAEIIIARRWSSAKIGVNLT
jgi:hypothetical protein